MVKSLSQRAYISMMAHNENTSHRSDNGNGGAIKKTKAMWTDCKEVVREAK